MIHLSTLTEAQQAEIARGLVARIHDDLARARDRLESLNVEDEAETHQLRGRIAALKHLLAAL